MASGITIRCTPNGAPLRMALFGLSKPRFTPTRVPITSLQPRCLVMPHYWLRGHMMLKMYLWMHPASTPITFPGQPSAGLAARKLCLWLKARCNCWPKRWGWIRWNSACGTCSGKAAFNPWGMSSRLVFGCWM